MEECRSESLLFLRWHGSPYVSGSKTRVDIWCGAEVEKLHDYHTGTSSQAADSLNYLRTDISKAAKAKRLPFPNNHYRRQALTTAELQRSLC